jgi:CBS domain-containing protein
MRDKGIGFIPIVNDQSKVVGVLTDRDLALRVVAAWKSPGTTAKEVMSTNVISVDPDADILDAEKAMVSSRKSRVPLVDADGICQGVVSLADVAQYESKRRAGEILKTVTRRETKPEIPLDLM